MTNKIDKGKLFKTKSTMFYSLYEEYSNEIGRSSIFIKAGEIIMFLFKKNNYLIFLYKGGKIIGFYNETFHYYLKEML